MTQQHQSQIVVPIDFSPHSGAAVQWASFWQQHTGAQVTVVHCRQFEAPPAFTLDQVETLARQAKRSEGQYQQEVADFLQQQLGHPVAWDIRVSEGDPVQLILEHCDCADLVIMGTHGRRGVQRWMLGSVAEGMIHAAQVPVLVVRHVATHIPQPPRIQRVLTPVTYTTRDLATVRAAADIAALFDAELYTLHVVEPHIPHGEHEALPDTINNIVIRPLERSGKPAEEILATAREMAADLLVVANAPKRLLEIDILPPTLTQVLQYGTVPVLELPKVVAAEGGQP